MVAGKRKDTRFSAEEASGSDDRIEEQIVQEITEQVLVEFLWPTFWGEDYKKEC
jgi:hypothetical protein